MRRDGAEADIWSREPVWGDGVELDDGQDRAAVPVGGRYGAGVECDVRAGWARCDDDRRAARLESGDAVGEFENRLFEERVRADGRVRAAGESGDDCGSEEDF